MAVIRIVKSFSRNLRPITKSFWNVCPANGFKWNGRANKLSEFVQIPRRLRSVCPAGVTWGLRGGSDPPPLFLAAVESSHPIFSSGENVISGRGGRAQPWEEGGSTPTGCSQPCQNLSKLSFILVIVAKLNISKSHWQIFDCKFSIADLIGTLLPFLYKLEFKLLLLGHFCCNNGIRLSGFSTPTRLQCLREGLH